MPIRVEAAGIRTAEVAETAERESGATTLFLDVFLHNGILGVCLVFPFVVNLSSRVNRIVLATGN